MNPQTFERLFGANQAFRSPIVFTLTLIVAALLIAAPLVIFLLNRLGKLDATLRDDLIKRYKSWLILAPLMIVPVLLGAAWTILAVALLSLLCYREFARATGLFRERAISFTIVLGILLTAFASIDNWYAFFTALWPLTVGSIALVGILQDQPKGYIQRIGLGVLAYMLFGCCLGHLGFFANDANYRQILFWVILCVELNDVFAYICGKSFGRRKLCPNTSPKKTIGGALGAVLLTTILSALLSRAIFEGTPIASWRHSITMGFMLSVLGQFGDLLLSSIKRDIGIKDMAATFPGHGGLLDRFDSLILVAPAIFHYVGYYLGVGLDQPAKIFTGG